MPTTTQQIPHPCGSGLYSQRLTVKTIWPVIWHRPKSGPCGAEWAREQGCSDHCETCQSLPTSSTRLNPQLLSFWSAFLLALLIWLRRVFFFNHRVIFANLERLVIIRHTQAGTIVAVFTRWTKFKGTSNRIISVTFAHEANTRQLIYHVEPRGPGMSRFLVNDKPVAVSISSSVKSARNLREKHIRLSRVVLVGAKVPWEAEVTPVDVYGVHGDLFRRVHVDLEVMKWRFFSYEMAREFVRAMRGEAMRAQFVNSLCLWFGNDPCHVDRRFGVGSPARMNWQLAREAMGNPYKRAPLK